MPPALRAAAAPGQRTGYQLTWQGATVLQQWIAQIQTALEQEREEIAEDFQTTMRAEHNQGTHPENESIAGTAYCVVKVAGPKRTIVLGATAEHTYYHEVKPYNYPPHGTIREVMSRHVPHLTPRIRAARGR
jgi:hypothetical protein